jgi:hypothetical protein
MRLDDLPVPDSPAARLAGEVSTAYHSPALVNHCVRSYLWAASLGLAEGLTFDADLLHVAAMLHDLGLVAAFDSHTLDFEQAGGHVAWVFAAGAGWPVGRRRRLAEVIVRHMWRAVDPDDDPEGYLLGLGTGLDISGSEPDRWPRELRAQVVARYPRLDLADEFVRCLQDQAARKPTSAASRLVAGGLAERMAGNPLE